jgi:AraC-like DNA-binding protein
LAKIVKTRQAQPPTINVVEKYDSRAGKARGILRRTLVEGSLEHFRRSPAPELSPWIAHYWIITWDLRGCERHIAESLPHPNIHLIFEKSKSVISGVQTRRFSRMLTGKSRVFGVKFRAGAFRPFFGKRVSELANRTIPAKRVFGKDLKAFETIALSCRPEQEKVAAANRFFLARIPKINPTIDLASDLVNRILVDPEIKTVEKLVAKSKMNKRKLQRIFSDYVGVSPKWVVCRYRLHELIERLNSGEDLEWPQVALDLGYFDQAHLINDFRSLLGCTPAQYAKEQARNRNG